MIPPKTANLPGLTSALKNKLIQQALERKLRQAGQEQQPASHFFTAAQKKNPIPEAYTCFDQYSGYRQLHILNEGTARNGPGQSFLQGARGQAARLRFFVSCMYEKMNIATGRSEH